MSTTTTCTFCDQPATGETMDYSTEPPEYAPVCDVHAGPQRDEA